MRGKVWIFHKDLTFILVEILCFPSIFIIITDGIDLFIFDPLNLFVFLEGLPFLLFHRPCRLIKVSSSSSSTTAKENVFFPPYIGKHTKKSEQNILCRYITKESLFYVWLYVKLIPLWGSCVHSIRFNRFIIDFSFKNNVSPLQLLCL